MCSHDIRRRRLLQAGVGGVALAAAGWLRAGGVRGTGGGATVELECFDDDGTDRGRCVRRRLVLDDRAWRARLSPAAYAVMRQHGTEPPFSGAHEPPAVAGLYRCPACANALFDAAAQFDSGTGWPSFWQPIARRNVTTARDFSLGWPRTAVGCARCDSHLGHVFADGPPPTGLRYCINAVALRFVPRPH